MCSYFVNDNVCMYSTCMCVYFFPAHALLAHADPKIVLVPPQYTVQDDLLVRVIFGEFVCEKQLVDFILAI